jgi:hypothetical protein
MTDQFMLSLCVLSFLVGFIVGVVTCLKPPRR